MIGLIRAVRNKITRAMGLIRAVRKRITRVMGLIRAVRKMITRAMGLIRAMIKRITRSMVLVRAMRKWITRRIFFSVFISGVFCCSITKWQRPEINLTSLVEIVAEYLNIQLILNTRKEMSG
jgi:abortive infection bacteriophage resistance protein